MVRRGDSQARRRLRGEGYGYGSVACDDRQYHFLLHGCDVIVSRRLVISASMMTYLPPCWLNGFSSIFGLPQSSFALIPSLRLYRHISNYDGKSSSIVAPDFHRRGEQN